MPLLEDGLYACGDAAANFHQVDGSAGKGVPRGVCKGGFWWGFGGPRWVPWRGARGYGSRADREGSHGAVRWGGVGLSLRLPCIREESELLCRHVTCVAEGRAEYLIDPFNADELVSALFV